MEEEPVVSKEVDVVEPDDLELQTSIKEVHDAQKSNSAAQSTKGNLGNMHSCIINKYDSCMLGITIVIGGQYFGWNIGLSMGFGSYVIALFLIGLGYLILSLSLAELASCVPFGGIISDLTCFLRLTEPYLSFLM